MWKANDKLKAVFLDALDRTSPLERAAFLDVACAGDGKLRQQVEKMLQAHDQEDRFFDRPVALFLDDATPEVDESLVQNLRPLKAGTKGGWSRLAVLMVVGGMGLLAGIRAFQAWSPRPTEADASAVETEMPAAAWIRSVADLPLAERAAAVVDRLKKRNPGYDGEPTFAIRDQAVYRFSLSHDEVSDIGPLRALPMLTEVECYGTAPGEGKLADLSPLKGLALKRLDVSNTRVTSLLPLQGMPLGYLFLSHGLVHDLSPLRGMPLRCLDLASLPVTDLSVLKDLDSLSMLTLEGVPASDLRVLKGLPLKYLDIRGTGATDLSPLEGMSLDEILLDFTAEQDFRTLREMTGLKRINNQPASLFWKALGRRP